MNSANPDISIIVPIYNKEVFLESCLSSLSQQSGVSAEFILVDDGSTDSSGVLAKRFTVDPRFRYFFKENGGASSARNFGIRVATGRYLAFVDADDVLSRGFSNTFVKEADRSKADIVSGGKCGFTGDFEFQEGDVSFNELSSLEFIKSGFSACGRLFRRDLFENEEHLFPEGVWAEDNGYIPYIASKAKLIVGSDSFFYGYRSSVDGSASTSIRCVVDTPKSMLYLRNICCEEDLLVYTLFKSLTAAICRTQNRGFRDELSLSEFLALEDTKGLFLSMRDINFLEFSRSFSGFDRLEFVIFCLFLKGNRFFGVVLYNIRRVRALLSRIKRRIKNFGIRALKKHSFGR